MPKFDDRLPPKGDDGSDFQRFVWEALRTGYFESLLAGRYLRPYFSSGRDGAIDHLGISGEDQIVFECKFFGKDRDDQPSRDWRKVAERLGRNLEESAANSPDKITRPYRPWFDLTQPIKGYWFCTSGDLSPGAQAELGNEIKSFFSVIAKHPTGLLAHLANIKVEVLGWNDFEGVLSAKSPLNFRWFQQLPAAFRPLRSITEGKTFRKFLQDDTLKYFSWTDFNRETHSGAQLQIRDEHSILSMLIDGDNWLGLILTGPGGVGKTRLALQLGIEAESHNWHVLRVDSNATRDGIENLARDYTSPARILLVIDYAEAAKSLSDLVQEMQRVNQEGLHRFRFIATCRASALSTVKEALDEIMYKVVEFSGEPDDSYGNWVVRKILASGQIPQIEDIANICSGIPVLAAFAVYLFQQFPEDFSIQFGQIHRGDDFAKWADKRLQIALNAQGLDAQFARRRLASLVARLPLSAEEHYALRGINDDTVRLLDLLHADRWVEKDAEGNGDGISVVHDIFADAIIGHYIFESTATVTDRTGDVLCDAAVSKKLENALIAVNRLAANVRYNRIDGVAIVRRIHNSNLNELIAARNALLRIRLPDESVSIKILSEFPDLAAAIAADKSCDRRVSLLADFTAKAEDGAWREEAARILEPLLDQATERCFPVSVVARRALRLSPTRYKAKAMSWIRRLPDHADFIIRAWLEGGGDFDAIRTPALEWFKNNATKKEAVYLLKYLAKESDLPSDSIDEMIGWCAKFPDDSDTVFRIGSIATHFGDGPYKLMLIEVALLVMTHVNNDRLRNSTQRHATLRTLGWLCSQYIHYQFSYMREPLDTLHADLFLESEIYSTDGNNQDLYYWFGFPLAAHVADMITRGIIDVEVDIQPLQTFASWLASWPQDHSDPLCSALQALKLACPIPGLWSHIDDHILLLHTNEHAPETNKSTPETNKPNLEKLLKQLSDFELSPPIWSYNWEKKAWKYFPGDVRLVALTKQWLRQAKSDPSWPYVWQPLFNVSPDDQEIIDIAIWWLKERGPRDRGAWAYVWKLLWDNNCAREQIGTLGNVWLQEFELREHKYWWDVWDRLWESEIQTDKQKLKFISNNRLRQGDKELQRPSNTQSLEKNSTISFLPEINWGGN